MIKLEHVVLASPEQMEFIIEGMTKSYEFIGKRVIVMLVMNIWELEMNILNSVRTIILSCGD